MCRICKKCRYFSVGIAAALLLMMRFVAWPDIFFVSELARAYCRLKKKLYLCAVETRQTNFPLCKSF